MKQLIEDMKARKARIPPPGPTGEEKAKLGPRGGGGYEGRLRALYLPGGDGRPDQAFGQVTGQGPPDVTPCGAMPVGQRADPVQRDDDQEGPDVFTLRDVTSSCGRLAKQD